MWELQKISMRADRHGPVVTSQLASNAFGRRRAGRRCRGGRDAVRDAHPRRRTGRPRRLGHDRLLGAGVRHPARPPAARPAGGAVRRAGRPRAGQGRADRRRDVRAPVRRRRRGDRVEPPAGPGRPGGADGAQPHPPQQAAADGAARPAAARAQQRDDGARPALVAGAAPGRRALAARLPDAAGGAHRGPRGPAAVDGAARLLRRAVPGDAAAHARRARVRRGRTDRNARPRRRARRRRAWWRRSPTGSSRSGFRSRPAGWRP